MTFPIRRIFRTLLALAALLPLSGCFFRTHRVEQRQIAGGAKEASRDDLVARINEDAQKIRTLNATVDIAAASGGEKKGKVTEYQEIRGYILVRKPKDIRLIGLFPVVRNKAFDMVSDGETFRVSIPTKNRFIVGRDDVAPQHPKQTIENLRPQFIFDALLLQEVDPQNEVAVLESTTDVSTDPKSKKPVERATYTIAVVHRGPNGTWYLARKVVFDRDDLEPHRQIVYDKHGNVATDARYDNFKVFNDLLFPSIITIYRPLEEYTVQLSIVKVKLNEALHNDQFELPQPPGSQLVRLDEAEATAATPPTPGPR